MEMDAFSASAGRPVLEALIAGIHGNAARLSQIDGATGDGDHGINMDKGFLRAGELLGQESFPLARGLSVLGKVLITEIGGAMGPLYGSFYLDMAGTVGDAEEIDGPLFGKMLGAGIAAIQDLGEAKQGDKTLLDSLLPAQTAFSQALDRGETFAAALGHMAEAAEQGSEATRDMVARIGRASRLGERSRGFLDAGSVSCAIQLRAMADSMAALLRSEAATGEAG
jgi:phosphoenolpyruvate---glycerone phosphotransferase subunit DhaL